MTPSHGVSQGHLRFNVFFDSALDDDYSAPGLHSLAALDSE